MLIGIAFLKAIQSEQLRKELLELLSTFYKLSAVRSVIVELFKKLHMQFLIQFTELIQSLIDSVMVTESMSVIKINCSLSNILLGQ